MLLSYKTRNGNTFTFSFERQADRSIACCIVRMPPSIPRNASLYETHREYKEGRYFIDPPHPPRSIEEAKSIAGHWAESIEQYGQGLRPKRVRTREIAVAFTRAYKSILEFLRYGNWHSCSHTKSSVRKKGKGKMTILGNDEQGKPVEISIYDRLTGKYVIGANGTGKSTLLEQLIIQDIEAGMGCCLLDPHGELTSAVINRIPKERLDDVIYLDPLDVNYPFGLNVFACDDAFDPEKVEHSVEQIVQIFSKVFGMSVETPRLNQYVRHIAYTLIGTPYTMIEIPNLLLEKNFRDRVVPRMGSTGLFWKSYDSLRPVEQIEQSASTRDRIDLLVSNSIIRNIVGQSMTTINFRDVMEKGKILLVSLPARYESLTSLLGSIIIGQLLTAALNRAGGSKRRQFDLYADEYQRFATPDFATLLTEARKFGVATTIAHQVRSQLDEKNASTALQAGSLVVFRVTAEDAEELAPSFNLTPRPGDPIERPVRTYKQEVIQHLLEKGHTSKDANEYVNELLRPMQELLDQLKDKVARTAVTGRLTKTSSLFIDGSTYYTFASHLREGMAKVNHILVLAMEGKLSICSQQYQTLVCDAVITLRGYLEVQGGVEEVDEEKIPLPPQLYPFVADVVRFECQLNYDNPSQEKQENDKKIAREIKATRIKHLRENLNYWLIQRENYSDKFVNEGVRWRASTEFGGITSFMAWLYLLCNELIKDPIMVDSGKYEQFEGPRQTYSDRANEVANELVQLKRGQARVKLPGGEFLLTTIVPETNKKGLQAKKQQIIENTREKYCKPRSEVEEEIRRRQDGDGPPPSVTRKHPV